MRVPSRSPSKRSFPLQDERLARSGSRPGNPGPHPAVAGERTFPDFGQHRRFRAPRSSFRCLRALYHLLSTLSWLYPSWSYSYPAAPPLGRLQRPWGGTAYAPGGLQQQMPIEARQEENRRIAIDTIRAAGALPPVGRGRRTTTPAWMSTGTGGPALATDGLQQQELSGVQRAEGMPSATAATRSAEISPPGERGRRMTNPAWTSAETRGPDPAPRGIQQQAPRRPGPGRDRIRPLSPPAIHARRGRETSDDRSYHERGRETVRRLPLEGVLSLLCPHPNRGS